MIYIVEFNLEDNINPILSVSVGSLATCTS